ncbi:SMI1/KNR4 family protein [Corallococcus exiguus]|uniref:SMI1/KNR4 family protein n=1 Tax=Corallococcus exiguus TaxID=83462 RepID=UPI001493EE41|nr:SMI1/KNR4 family protein [Corallococcus exiguus]NPC74476.1 SMI1/KNR4 family protein [Corallococcus exiguus]NPD27546.1 SMI1/KNR4 family protein [Corallococcus exiguus]
MNELLDEISRLHAPNPPATPEQLDAFEQRVGWRLDPDLRAFYLYCDGARLFAQRDPTFGFVDPAFTFLPLSRIARARVVMCDEDSDQAGPPSWYAICEVRDSNYILLDVSHQEGRRYSVRDGYNEAFPDPEYCARIASSFQEFLAGALRSQGRWFWLRTEE